MRALWDASETLVTSWISLPEVRSALERAHRSGRIGSRRLQRALSELDDVWPDLIATRVDHPVAVAAAALTGTHPLRGQDAIHLASALRLDVPELVLATWDGRLRQAALDEGLAVAPA